VALGPSNPEMGQQQHAVGLHRMPLATGERAVRVFETGMSHRSGRVDEDPQALAGLIHGLGIRSENVAPLDVAGTRREVVLASKATHAAFSDDDLRFLEAIGRWGGMVAHRSELNQRLRVESSARGQRDAGEELMTVLAHDIRNLLTPLAARVQPVRFRASCDGRERDVARHPEPLQLGGRASTLSPTWRSGHD
jgi:two-component system OmpR family sensor kinase